MHGVNITRGIHRTYAVGVTENSHSATVDTTANCPCSSVTGMEPPSLLVQMFTVSQLIPAKNTDKIIYS